MLYICHLALLLHMAAEVDWWMNNVGRRNISPSGLHFQNPCQKLDSGAYRRPCLSVCSFYCRFEKQSSIDRLWKHAWVLTVSILLTAMMEYTGMREGMCSPNDAITLHSFRKISRFSDKKMLFAIRLMASKVHLPRVLFALFLMQLKAANSRSSEYGLRYLA